jgi:hypothetical protein
VSAAPASAAGTAKPAAGDSHWLRRRYAGLPLVAWLVGGLLLAWAMAVTGWLLLSRGTTQRAKAPPNATATISDDSDRHRLSPPLA